MNPFALLVRSRKFWVAVLDVIVSSITLVVGTYFQAQSDFILKLIAVYQPLFLVVIGAIAAEDVAVKNSGGTPGQG